MSLSVETANKGVFSSLVHFQQNKYRTKQTKKPTWSTVRTNVVCGWCISASGKTRMWQNQHFVWSNHRCCFILKFQQICEEQIKKSSVRKKTNGTVDFYPVFLVKYFVHVLVVLVKKSTRSAFYWCKNVLFLSFFNIFKNRSPLHDVTFSIKY